MTNSFSELLFKRLLTAQYAEYPDNYDDQRFPPKQFSFSGWLEWQLRCGARNTAFIAGPGFLSRIGRFLHSGCR